ncbi:MAG: YggS family pyridoxal phosphate-dependent enzyme [Gammaproteobacteria bacterium]|nr:MAG: YggS family pyridoxal phosphate-dependent enzyme [Gammaproteobacteria bacterium]
MSSIADNIVFVTRRIQKATADAGRPAGSVTLLAVSKTRPAEDIRAAYEAGLTHFGENYLQEALDKQARLTDLPLVWHFIGPIQSNKTRAIAEHFDWVHSVDREKIARRLSEQRPVHLPPLNICLQVNIDNEPTKAGVAPDDLHALANVVKDMPHLRLRGLMCIPEPKANEADAEATFRRMAHLKDALNASLDLNLDTLSMGMSGDIEPAIRAGATLVRVGTALFGPRAPKPQETA